MIVPKIFWKYFDWYRRKIITLSQYERLTGINKELLVKYLAYIAENQ